MYCASEGHLDVCRLLVEAGANTLVRRCDHGVHSLHALSCHATHLACLRDDNTALRISVMFGKSHVATYLRSVGAPL